MWGWKKLVCTYRITAKNKGTKEESAVIVAPVPPHAEPVFEPAPDVVKTDEWYGNRYASWSLRLNAGETKTIEYCWTHSASKEKNRGFSLEPNRFIRPDDPRVMEIANGLRSVKDVYQWVRGHLTYGDPITGLYSATDALERPRVDCGAYATLFVSLCIAKGIPARIVAGFFADDRPGNMHAWAEYLSPMGEWVAVDPTVRRRRVRVTMSYGCDIPVLGGRVDLLQHPTVFGSPSVSAIAEFTARRV